MELHIATSKEAADYDYATFNGTRTLTLAAGKSSLVIKPGTIIGYRDGRNVVYVVTPDKGLNSEYKISEDDFDRKVAPKCDSATKAQARKAFSGKVEKPAATVAAKPIAKPSTRTVEQVQYEIDTLQKEQTKLVADLAKAERMKARGRILPLNKQIEQLDDKIDALVKERAKLSKTPKTAVKSPVQQVAKETKAEIAKRNAETHKVIERAAKKAGEESLRKTKEKVATTKVPKPVSNRAELSELKKELASLKKNYSANHYAARMDKTHDGDWYRGWVKNYPTRVAQLEEKIKALSNPEAAAPKDLPITEKDIKAMAKKLKLPGGAGAVVNDTSYTWNKKGGFADSVLNPLRDNLKANGFTETDAKTLGLTGTAGSYFTDGKYVVYTAAHLGSVKTDNWYVITLTPIEKKA